MWMRKWAGLVLVCGLIVVQVSTAEGAGGAFTADDYVEIQQLYVRYHWAADAGDGKGWANLFSTDGEYEGGPFKAKGREQLAELPTKAFGPPTAKTVLHFVTNVWIQPTPEGARGGAYLLNVAPAEPGKPPTVTSMVVYEDVLVKTPEGWRLRSRKTHGADAGLTPSLLWPATK